MNTRKDNAPTPVSANGAARSGVSQTGWLVWGAGAVLAVTVFMVAALSIGRNESAMAQLLAEKGAALIRAIEGGLRTGMRSQMGVRLQALLEETVGPDIVFIAVTMQDGTILAHSKPERVGEILEMDGHEADEANMRSLLINSTGEEIHWRIVNMEGARTFVVYGDFMPGPKRGREGVPAIFLGMDITPFETTRANDRVHLLAFAGGLLLFGLTCLLALHYALRAKESRRRQKMAEGQVLLLEEEVRRKEKLAAIGNLAAGVAHEIRNPLSSIKGLATYFGQRFPKDSEDREAAAVMVREVERLNRVITDLIGLSHPTDISSHPTDAASVVAHALTLLRQDAEHHNVRLHLDAPAHLPLALLDADRFVQALLNVCLNAIEAIPHGPHGGDVTIRLSVTAHKTLCIEITDSGEGIRPEDLPHIFDPYFTTKGQGTGLGLATVHQIMGAHGGDVRVVSRHHEGTTVYITVPLAEVSL